MIYSRDGRHRLLFIEVPESKQIKNRIHLDLQPADSTRDAELELLTDTTVRVSQSVTMKGLRVPDDVLPLVS
jgi:hypothetical protein